MSESVIATVGTFDGVHRGHLAVLDTLASEGRKRNLKPLIISFTSHPLSLIAPERAPGLLISAERKLELLSATGMEVCLLDFTTELCSLTARQWMERLRDKYNVAALVIGHDNTFGSDGRFIAHDRFRVIGREVGLDVIEAPCLPGISSSAIRRAVREGDVVKAGDMLGRPFGITGVVVHGHQLGRKLGFPTANIHTSEQQLLPLPGVYAAMIDGAADSPLPAVCNIGSRPTVENGSAVLTECHIPGWSGDLYGKTLSVSFTRRLRDEKKFSGLDELKAAIAHDCQRAQSINEL